MKPIKEQDEIFEHRVLRSSISWSLTAVRSRWHSIMWLLDDGDDLTINHPNGPVLEAMGMYTVFLDDCNGEDLFRMLRVLDDLSTHRSGHHLSRPL